MEAAIALRDRNGNEIGVARAIFSLARENDLLNDAKLAMIILAGSAGLCTSLVLFGLARTIIVRPLVRLTQAARAIGAGEPFELKAHSRDEIGELTAALVDMSSAILDREERLDARNKALRMVLDHVNQGFLTVGRDGVMASERSKIIDEWFGVPADKATIWTYLGQCDAKLGTWLALGWESLNERDVPLELSLEQLPRLIVSKRRTFSLDYRPIGEFGQLKSVLLVINDISADLERQHTEQVQHETVAAFERIMRNREGFVHFYQEASEMVEQIAEQDDPMQIARVVHTLKGNCGFYSLQSMVSACHRFEDVLIERQGVPLPSDREIVTQAWQAVEERIGRFLASRGSVEVSDASYEWLVQELRNKVPHARLLRSVKSWRHNRALMLLERLSEGAQQVARRLKRGSLQVDVQAEPELRLAPELCASLAPTIAHLITNAVDHGIETPDDREAAGKNPVASLRLVATAVEGQLVITIADDGRGIDWQAIHNLAQERGLPVQSHDDLVAALLAPGFSTRDQVTTTSGRGVGLDAVAADLFRLGGRVSVHSVLGVGTTWTLTFPSQAHVVEDSDAAHAA